ncbi:hypothetical protein DFH07DRAFT_1065085 [Mycena maculata]|uniref:Uncharacterized protein n=1 Tax=Mycena maculata TaxID=230809 RepID=A0AAD7I520_9AGAR|nr:hypothetical protein DFH07DRAFT_1065085 [Mycena maculata]
MASEQYNPYLEVAPVSPFPPNRATKDESLENGPELETVPRPRLGYYPVSLIALAVWLMYIIVLIWLLESAVAHGPRSLSQPWAYTTLPSLLITVFAQGHTAITAMHLSRVSVSALHSPRTSPNTWAEVFWMSDRAWQGPVGVAMTFLAAARLRVRTSAHFILCAVTCLTALVTPVVLSRAYPIRSIAVYQDTTITPNALSVTQMGAVDAYAEIGTGVGSWTAGLSVSDIYNSSVYTPIGASRTNDPLDFFFAGNIEGLNATLPGLRLSGQCIPVESNVSSFADFPAYCNAQIPNVQTFSGIVTISPVSVNLTMQMCNNASWASLYPTATSALSTNVGYIYLTSSNTSAPPYPGINVTGMIRCDSETTTGTAVLSGSTLTYTDFTAEPLYNETQGGEPLLDPLFALFYYFGSEGTTGFLDNDVSRAAVVRALGFAGLSPGDGDETYSQPALADLATAFWRGVTYTVAGIGLLSRANDTPYFATQRGQAAVYIREQDFAVGVYALLAFWLILVVFITARSFRPTFADSFDSYITARLLLDRPELVRDANGELAANEKLREPFGWVGRDELRRVVAAEQ